MKYVRMTKEELLKRYTEGERDFSKIYLYENLNGVDLRCAIFSDSDLRCDMYGADLSRCNLSNAEISGQVSGINLRDTNLIGATMAELDLRGACLINADMSNADLSQSILDGALLVNVNFSNAYLGEVSFQGANLTNANLKDAVEFCEYLAILYNTTMPDGTVVANRQWRAI